MQCTMMPALRRAFYSARVTGFDQRLKASQSASGSSAATLSLAKCSCTSRPLRSSWLESNQPQPTASLSATPAGAGGASTKRASAELLRGALGAVGVLRAAKGRRFWKRRITTSSCLSAGRHRLFCHALAPSPKGRAEEGTPSGDSTQVKALAGRLLSPTRRPPPTWNAGSSQKAAPRSAHHGPKTQKPPRPPDPRPASPSS
jgi:hypothetical protein